MKRFIVAGQEICFEELVYEGKEFLIIPQRASRNEKQRIRNAVILGDG